MTGRHCGVATHRVADTIINLRYMTTNVTGSAVELLACSTVVKLSEQITLLKNNCDTERKKVKSYLDSCYVLA